MINLKFLEINIAEKFDVNERLRIGRLFNSCVNLAQKLINGNNKILTAYCNIYNGIYDVIQQKHAMAKEQMKSLVLKETYCPSSDHQKISQFINAIPIRILHPSELKVTIRRTSGESRNFDLDDACGGFSVDHGRPVIFLCPLVFDYRMPSENTII